MTYHEKWDGGVAHGAKQMGQKRTKNEKKVLNIQIIEKCLKLALGLPLEMCLRI